MNCELTNIASNYLTIDELQFQSKQPVNLAICMREPPTDKIN